MSDNHKQQFGGNWTEIKLEKVEKYLRAYSQIMKNQNFTYAYIDSFAGTGYRNIETTDSIMSFENFFDDESQKFLDGSARIALKVTPHFSKYIFIEKDPKRFDELSSLRDEFPQLAGNIVLKNLEANKFLQNICNKNWTRHRAVLFLDPFGMQVEWKTIEAIASTNAVDLWLLFPLGVAVNRMLRRDANIPEGWKLRLNSLFGTDTWMDAFYKTRRRMTLFGEEEFTEKVEDPFRSISEFFVERLKSAFGEENVANNPLPLYNSRGNPLYLLCFAAANPKGAPTAIKIAQHILSR